MCLIFHDAGSSNDTTKFYLGRGYIVNECENGVSNLTNFMGHTAMIVSTDNGNIIYAQHDDNKNDGDLKWYLEHKNEPGDYNYVFVIKIRDDA